jgi:hypothetical protein
MDMAEKYGEEVSEIDEQEQKKIMELVEKELEQGKDWNEVPDEVINEMPESQIIKEED